MYDIYDDWKIYKKKKNGDQCQFVSYTKRLSFLRKKHIQN